MLSAVISLITPDTRDSAIADGINQTLSMLVQYILLDPTYTH